MRRRCPISVCSFVCLSPVESFARWQFLAASGSLSCRRRYTCFVSGLVFSGNGIAHISEVTLRRTGLVLKVVTVVILISHTGHLSLATRPWVGAMSTGSGHGNHHVRNGEFHDVVGHISIVPQCISVRVMYTPSYVGLKSRRIILAIARHWLGGNPNIRAKL